MNTRHPKLAALALAAVLAAPTGAWAQGAVDEEYRESFPGQGDGGSDTNQPAPTDDTGSSDNAAPTAPSGTAPTTTAAPAETPAATTAGELPRSGLPAVLIAVTGGALLAAGSALRRRSR